MGFIDLTIKNLVRKMNVKKNNIRLFQFFKKNQFSLFWNKPKCI